MRTGLLGALLLFPVAALSSFSPCQAQDTVKVADAVTCPTCVIVLDTLLELGGMDGPGIHLISPWAHVASDSRGLVLVAGGRFPEIAVFDSLGTFLQVVGGKGDGPGEYRGISHIDAGPRYLQVFEYNGRRTLLDSSYAPLRVDQLPGVVLSSWITTADTAILAADFRSPGSVGDPLHLLSLDGTLSSYGSDSRVVKGPSPTLVVGGIGDQVWSLNQGTNEATLWIRSGDSFQRGRVFEREMAWFERGVFDEPTWPKSYIESVRADTVGVWVVGNAPDPDFTDFLIGSQPIPDTPLNDAFDGWVEVFSPTSGRVLARQQLDDMLLGSAGPPDVIVSYHETDSGVPFIQVLKIHLLRPPRRETEAFEGGNP